MVNTVPEMLPVTLVGKSPLRAMLVALFPVYVIVVIALPWVTVWLALPPVWVIVGTVCMVATTEASPLVQPAAEVVTA
jgi:hypothetical protein